MADKNLRVTVSHRLDLELESGTLRVGSGGGTLGVEGSSLLSGRDRPWWTRGPDPEVIGGGDCGLQGRKDWCIGRFVLLVGDRVFGGEG